MSELTPLAGAVEVRDLLESLVGREVDVLTGAKGQDPAKGDGCLVGVYLDDTQQIAALVLLDVAAAAYLGGALGLVPVKMAQQAVNHGGLPAGLLENASEILNVLGSLLNAEGAPHVRLDAARALRAIRELPDAYRETLVLRLVEGLTGPEIAAVTGLTPDSVRVNLHRGFKLLRERLGIAT